MAIDPDDIDLITARTVAVYKEAEAQLLAIMRDHITRGIDAPEWAQTRLTALSSLRRAAQSIVGALTADGSRRIREAVAEAYRTGQGAALLDLPERWFPRSGIGEAAQAATAVVPRVDAMESLANALVQDMGERCRNVLRNVEDIFRQVQSAAVARSIGGGVTRRQASQAAWQRLVDDGVTSFVDRRGRRWRLTSYVEMAVRTVTMRAAVQGQTDRLETLGIDTVIVSNEAQECERCRPYEGKILARGSGPVGKVTMESLTTGQPVTVNVMTTLDDARRAGLLHPMCRHAIRAYLPGATRQPKGETAQPEQHKARQRQREIERQIRRYKEQALAALTPEAKRAANAKVRAWQGAMGSHLKSNPYLKRLPYREQIGAGNLPPGGRTDPAGRLPGRPEQLTLT